MRVAYIHSHMTIDQSASVATGPNIAFVSIIVPSSTQRCDPRQHRQREQTERVEREDGEAHRNAAYSHMPQAVDDPQHDKGPGNTERIDTVAARQELRRAARRERRGQ